MLKEGSEIRKKNATEGNISWVGILFRQDALVWDINPSGGQMAAVNLFILNSVSHKNECSQGDCEVSSS